MAGDTFVPAGYVVAARVDKQCNMTGEAEVVRASEGDNLCNAGTHTTFGTWEAFEANLKAQRALNEKAEQKPVAMKTPRWSAGYSTQFQHNALLLYSVEGVEYKEARNFARECGAWFKAEGTKGLLVQFPGRPIEYYTWDAFRRNLDQIKRKVANQK
ncbi:MAG: hypothetical protein A2919_01100 [Candidatus Spechtbacteria bacterium RIFCSPLOWO2_01_FULL_43_12]|uniref:Uncharacterized protein n=1 Tax=Candidatus Spechtbacteria bacterium RIFCSPLOWO2_01_FULL_43_12 TaxID=1802162 RepID=A0A1G2HE24_9BACT|nr:MAG: hypothetical protein A2919_01100 [Candidatus Spechtbacteria bacterium RIFCSPLOWO2_01_FULL_43_12]